MSIRKTVVAVLPLFLLVLGVEARAQAGNVVCTKCVDAKDIATEAVTTVKIESGSVLTSRIDNQAVNAKKLASGAVSSAKIKKGAVTLSKVVPKLKNAIGTGCAPGKVVVGKDSSGHLVCEDPAPAYYPYGPQVDVHPSELNEWTECYSGNYGESGANLDVILSNCNGTYLMLACREAGQTRINLLAAGNRIAVTTDTGNQKDALTTPDNGVEWYYNNSYSWGYAGEGDVVDKFSCDVEQSGDNDQRLCWHTGNNALSSGYRCGETTSFGAAWERLVFHAGNIQAPPQ